MTGFVARGNKSKRDNFTIRTFKGGEIEIFFAKQKLSPLLILIRVCQNICSSTGKVQI